jgi:predicted TIM-barrel fold metal-dependent hydrolase
MTHEKIPAAPLLALSLAALAAPFAAGNAQVPEDALFHDSHFHLTNYIQEGTDIEDFVDIMGDKVGRVALFGIPLQQTWSYENTGDFAPTYYLQTDAPLYYYSFTDAFIAQAYLSLDEDDRDRFDPMITGFNPADMYAADHIRRVLETFPGVFSGIGEFTIHKEFVSAKVAGDTASLMDPALDRILEFAGEVGLAVILHCDLDVPFAKSDMEPVYLTQIRDLLRRHPETRIIWAHIGMGRVVHPVATEASAGSAERPLNHLELVEAALNDPTLDHVIFDISWSEVAKYIVKTPEGTAAAARIVNQHPERFLFGTDEVAPKDQESYLSVYRQYAPFWAKLTPEARQAVTKGNYERVFDEARTRVRAWEAANAR